MPGRKKKHTKTHAWEGNGMIVPSASGNVPQVVDVPLGPRRIDHDQISKTANDAVHYCKELEREARIRNVKIVHKIREKSASCKCSLVGRTHISHSRVAETNRARMRKMSRDENTL